MVTYFITRRLFIAQFFSATNDFRLVGAARGAETREWNRVARRDNADNENDTIEAEAGAKESKARVESTRRGNHCRAADNRSLRTNL